MSLDYVKKGESVKASTVNSLIDAIGGNQKMSPDLNITTTTRGPQVSLPSNYGGPNHKPNELLDIEKYQLSGWPMTQLNLGPTIQDCLKAIRLHKADGTLENATSAFVVYQNSEDCPLGSNLSGYLLLSSDFGQDKLAGAAGWVKTMMEDPHPGGNVQAQLWSYGNGADLATVFTNVPDVGDVKRQLSATMSDNFIEWSALSSLEHLCGWDLVVSHVLSDDNDEQIPTHDIVFNRGQLDYWEQNPEDVNVVLRAEYVCLSAEYDSNDELTRTTWGWKIPLGEGATCSNGKTHTPNLTYGGNEIVFEIDRGDPGGAGDVFKDGYIWHGADTVNVGQQVSPDPVFINLSWDYHNKYVMGSLSNAPSQSSYSQDGILHRSIYVAKCAPFTPSNMAKVGDGADGELVEHGTYGDFAQDGPKMDSYCQHESGVRFQSLDWDDLGGRVVDCQVQQLHDFSDLENNTDAEEEDELVVRRKDDDGGAEICYVNLSSLLSAEVQTDTDSPNTDLSSIQWTEDNGGQPVLQLFKFDDHQVETPQDSDEVVVKRGDGVEYVQLSTIVVSGDTNQGTIGKSIETKEDGNGNKFHQLYNFDGGGLSDAIQVGVQLNGNAESLVPDGYEFVLRKNGASGEIEYAKIELSSYGVELSADSDVGAQKSIDIDNDVIQLHDMDENGADLSALVPHCFAEPQNPLSSLQAEFVIRKGGAGGEIGYVTLDLLQEKTPVDRDTYPTQKSLQYATIGNVSFLELNGFHSDQTADVPVAVLSSHAKPLLPANWQFLTRHKDQAGYWQLGYTNLSAMISGALSVEVDSDVVWTQRSLEWAEDNGEEYLQLYGMDVAGKPTENVNLKGAKDSYYDLLSGDQEFVIRTKVGGEIIYKNVAVTLSSFTSGTAFEISGDTNVASLGSKSIQTVEDNILGEKYHQLYNFDSINSYIHLSDLTEGCADFIIRQEDGGNGIHVNYVPWEELSVKVDTQGTTSRSIEKSSSTSELRLYDFLGCTPVYSKQGVDCPTFDTLSSDQLCFLMRYNGCEYTPYLRYYNLHNLTRYADSEDTDYLCKSLEVQHDNNLDKNFLQLYNFYEPTVQNFNFTLKYDDKPYHITNGLSSVVDKQILVRDGTGTQAELEYWDFTITAPKVGTGDITNELYQLIQQGGHCDCAQKWTWLSGYLDNLSAEYWVQGGDNSNCYGGSIGDSSKTKVIDLDGNTLEGDWTINGCLEVVGGLGTFDDGIEVTGCAYFNNGVFVDNGAASITNGCIQFSSTQVMFYDGIGVDGAAEIGSGCIWFNGTPVAFYDGIVVGSGKTLQIGNTTLSEAQLTALLQLI